MVVALLSLAVWLALHLPTFGGSFEGERLVRMQQSPGHVKGRFGNKPRAHSDLALVDNYRLRWVSSSDCLIAGGCRRV